MGVKNTQAVTARDGVLLPFEDGEGVVEQALPQDKVEKAPVASGKQVAKPKSPKAEPAFRPRQRPAFPLLLVFDDSQRSWEIIRIRKSPFRIGRLEGDLIIPLDGQLSASHAEIYLKEANGRLQWYLKDLDSRNGTYAHVTQVALSPNRAILIGGYRFQFEASSIPAPPAMAADRTQLPGAKGAKSDSTIASLVPLDMVPSAQKLVLSQSEQWIGRDPKQCSIVIDDPMISPKHVRVFRDKKGRWHAHCPDAVKGLWTQVDEVFLDRMASFQCGEQRFQIRCV